MSLGRPGQAAKRLVSPGLAEANDVVKQKHLAKFPPNHDDIAPCPIQAQPPAPELPLELVFKSLQSFPIGSGPGPDGLRADFLKGVVGQSLDSGVLHVLREFLQILVDAEVPDVLKPWLAGGSLVGVGKIDKSGRPIALNYDARPIVMGQVFRKLAFKCTFRLDAEGIKTRLLPHQLAVAVAGGPEILVHSARDWIAQNKGKTLSFCKTISVMPSIRFFRRSFWRNVDSMPLPLLALLRGVMGRLPIWFTRGLRMPVQEGNRDAQ